MNLTNTVQVFHSTGILNGTIHLPSSKSESNRALIINAQTGNTCELLNLSEANDTVLMQKLLYSTASELDVQDAGTVMRFLTAYFSLTNQPKTLKGTARMQERPIGILVEALRELGTTIDYLGKEGFPPLAIHEVDLSWPAQQINISGEVSSQYISALLLVAPCLPQGLTIALTGYISSKPYIEMTMQIMRHFGAKVHWVNERTIKVEPVLYQPTVFTIEADWSAAGYWFCMAAISKEADLFLPGLRYNSLQADRKVVEITKNWGLKTTFTEDGVQIQKHIHAEVPKSFAFDFKDCPDLAQTILVLCAATGVNLTATGLESLAIKETDRIAACTAELAKMGAEMQQTEAGWEIKPGEIIANSTLMPVIDTYHDHRMAMAWAAFGLLSPVFISNPEVVKKSYPGFWQALQQVGFTVQPSNYI